MPAPQPAASRLVVAAVASLLIALPAGAAVSLVVNTSADEVDATPGDGTCATAAGACSLRAALQEVNATADGGTVTFAFTEYTNLTFTTALPAVVRPLTLDGPDAVTLVLGRQLAAPAADGRVLTLNPGAGALVTLRDLRIGGGNVLGWGGGVLATTGSLRLVNVTLVGSQASESGGGLYFTGAGALELVGCYVESNLASGAQMATSTATGGGLHFDGSAGGALLVRESAFVANRAARSGGGLYVGGAATAELRNVTFTQNSAGPNVASWGGAIAGDTAALSLRHVTVTGNGAGTAGGLGLRFGASATLVNSVVAGNNGAIAAVEQDCQGPLTGSVASFIGAAGAGCTDLTDGVDGNRVGTLAAPLAAKLAPLSSLGTVAQLAMPPAIGSPLRDAGDAAACALPELATDMVGASRNPGTDGDASGAPGCDVGAVEGPAAGPPTITTFLAEPATLQAGQESFLRWSVANADTCTLTPGPGLDLPPEGGYFTGILEATTSYLLECTGLPGFPAAVGSVTVTVAAQPPVAIISFTASPASIAPGGSTTLSWEVVNATSCQLDDGDGAPPYPPDWSGAIGSGVVQPDVTTTYTLTCQGGGGPVSATATVTVESSPPAVAITAFTATPGTVGLGGTTLLAWTVVHATACRISGDGWTAGVSATGGSTSRTLEAALPGAVTFTLSCEGAGAPATATAEVVVAPGAVILAFTASQPVDLNSPITLSWQVVQADSCTLATGAAAGVPVAAGTGSMEVHPATSTNYTLQCVGLGPPATAQASVSYPPPRITAFAFDPPLAFPDSDVNISFSAEMADQCTLSDGSGSQIGTFDMGASGSVQTQADPGNESEMTYVLECSGPGGVTTEQRVLPIRSSDPETPTQGCASAGGTGRLSLGALLLLAAFGLAGARRRVR